MASDPSTNHTWDAIVPREKDRHVPWEKSLAHWLQYPGESVSHEKTRIGLTRKAMGWRHPLHSCYASEHHKAIDVHTHPPEVYSGGWSSQVIVLAEPLGPRFPKQTMRGKRLMTLEAHNPNSPPPRTSKHSSTRGLFPGDAGFRCCRGFLETPAFSLGCFMWTKYRACMMSGKVFS